MDRERFTRDDFNLLLDEIRANRSSIEKANESFLSEHKEIWVELNKINVGLVRLKSRFVVVAITFGVAGSKLANYIPFLR